MGVWSGISRFDPGRMLKFSNFRERPEVPLSAMSRRHQTAAGTNPSHRGDALAFPDRGPRARTAATFVTAHKQVIQAG
jgi:hypothetical protein